MSLENSFSKQTVHDIYNIRELKLNLIGDIYVILKFNAQS